MDFFGEFPTVATCSFTFSALSFDFQLRLVASG